MCLGGQLVRNTWSTSPHYMSLHVSAGIHIGSSLLRHCWAGDSSHHPPSAALSLWRMSAPRSPITDMHDVLTSVWWVGTVSSFPATSLSLWCSPERGCLMPAPGIGPKQVWSIVSRAAHDRTQWSVNLLVCSSWVGMAPGALEIPAAFQKAWHRQTCLGYDESAQQRVERTEPAIITAIRHSLSSVEEYKSLWDKACYQMGDISNWTTSKRHCTATQKKNILAPVFRQECLIMKCISVWSSITDVKNECLKKLNNSSFYLTTLNYLVSLLKKIKNKFINIYIYILY